MVNAARHSTIWAKLARVAGGRRHVNTHNAINPRERRPGHSGVLGNRVSSQEPERGGKLRIHGGILLPTVRDFKNGAFKPHVTPQGNTSTFEDDGSNYGSGCKVLIQRIGPWLLIEDDGGCGGAAVTFTGLYRRMK